MAYDICYAYSPEDDSFVMMGTQCYDKPVEDPPVFEAINQIPALPRSPMVETIGNTVSNPEPHLFATLSVLPSRVLLSQSIEIVRQVSAIKTVEGLTPNFICHPLPTNAIKVMKQWGGNALGIDQDEPLFVILISAAWSDVKGDTAVSTMTANTVDRVNSAAQALDVAHPYRYINYASAAQADEVFPGYGEENVQRLRQIQKAVDPHGVFTPQGLWIGFIN